MRAGRDISIDRAGGDAMAVWVGLHGYVGLRAVLPGFPWPPDDGMLEVLVDRLARVAA